MDQAATGLPVPALLDAPALYFLNSARAAGAFHHWPLSAPGLGAFSAIWTHRLPKAGAAPIVVTADATIDLQWIDRGFRVAGPDSHAATEDLPAGTLVIGFLFHPAAAAAWLSTNVSEIADGRPDLDALWGARARRFAIDVADDCATDGLVRSLQGVVARMSPGYEGPNHEMQATYRLIAAGDASHAPLVPWLSRRLGLSERTLRRRVEENFGYGPKTLDRILRYQRYIRLARNSSESTATLALEAGYSDQAHLIRESRRLARETPTAQRRLTNG